MSSQSEDQEPTAEQRAAYVPPSGPEPKERLVIHQSNWVILPDMANDSMLQAAVGWREKDERDGLKPGSEADMFCRAYRAMVSQVPQVESKNHYGIEMVSFPIRVTMRARWVPHFLAMLKYMQQLGSWGSTRTVSFCSDGDGDFRPKFQWPMILPSDAAPVKDGDGNRTYDAG